MKNIIFASGEDCSFGNKDGTLPWGKPLEADMELFKNVTKNTGVVVMGAGTFASLPRKLEGRFNIALMLRKDKGRVLAAKDGSKPDLTLTVDDMRAVSVEKVLKDNLFTDYSIIGGSYLVNSYTSETNIDCYYTKVKGVFNSDIKVICPLNHKNRAWEVIYNDSSLTIYKGTKGAGCV